LRGQEEAYFREMMDGEPEFTAPEGPYASYRAIDSAEIVVAIDSTLGYESIARGNKTAIFSIRGTLLGDLSRNYGWPEDFPDKGPFWTNKPDPDSFDRILDYLFEVDAAQWKKDVAATGFSSLMAYDPDNTTLKAIFEKELGTPPKRVD
jgi:surface carbohydrate biosynthesis protein